MPQRKSTSAKKNKQRKNKTAQGHQDKRQLKRISDEIASRSGSTQAYEVRSCNTYYNKLIGNSVLMCPHIIIQRPEMEKILVYGNTKDIAKCFRSLRRTFAPKMERIELNGKTYLALTQMDPKQYADKILNEHLLNKNTDNMCMENSKEWGDWCDDFCIYMCCNHMINNGKIPLPICRHGGMMDDEYMKNLAEGVGDEEFKTLGKQPFVVLEGDSLENIRERVCKYYGIEDSEYENTIECDMDEGWSFMNHAKGDTDSEDEEENEELVSSRKEFVAEALKEKLEKERD